MQSKFESETLKYIFHITWKFILCKNEKNNLYRIYRISFFSRHIKKENSILHRPLLFLISNDNEVPFF